MANSTCVSSRFSQFDSLLSTKPPHPCHSGCFHASTSAAFYLSRYWFGFAFYYTPHIQVIFLLFVLTIHSHLPDNFQQINKILRQWWCVGLSFTSHSLHLAISFIRFNKLSDWLEFQWNKMNGCCRRHRRRHRMLNSFAIGNRVLHQTNQWMWTGFILFSVLSLCCSHTYLAFMADVQHSRRKSVQKLNDFQW